MPRAFCKLLLISACVCVYVKVERTFAHLFNMNKSTRTYLDTATMRTEATLLPHKNARSPDLYRYERMSPVDAIETKPVSPVPVENMERRGQEMEACLRCKRRLVLAVGRWV